MNTENLFGFEERKKHGDVFFPFTHYRTLIPDYIHSFPPHWHEEIEIIFGKKGVCLYTICNESIPIHTGDILIIFPSIIHSISQHERDRYYGDTFIFNLTLINNNVDICSGKYFSKILNNQCTPYLLIRPETPNYVKYLTLIQNTYQLFIEKSNFYELAIKTNMSYLLLQLLCDEQLLLYQEKTSGHQLEVTREIIQYIELHFQENITLSTLSKEFNLSSFHISHIFKSSTGMSCIDYIITYRLTYAANQLKMSQNPIIQVAMDSGFNNISYFNRAFKKSLIKLQKNIV